MINNETVNSVARQLHASSLEITQTFWSSTFFTQIRKTEQLPQVLTCLCLVWQLPCTRTCLFVCFHMTITTWYQIWWIRSHAVTTGHWIKWCYRYLSFMCLILKLDVIYTSLTALIVHWYVSPVWIQRWVILISDAEQVSRKYTAYWGFLFDVE